MKILCVIVLYHCLLKNSKTYRTLKPKSNDLLVFDNSEQIQDISAYAKEAKYIHNVTNIGLSACYNSAGTYAKKHGYEWLLFLDQDTDFSDISVDDYVGAIASNPAYKMYVPLVKCGKYTMSPMKFKHAFALFSQRMYKGVTDIEDLSVINSGMCVSVDALQNCGGYNEKVFLDYSDHEFVRKFKKKYSQVYVLPRTIYQDYSAKSDAKDAALKRLVMFCESIRGCEKNTLLEKMEYSIPILKRTLALVVRNRSFRAIPIAYTHYFK